MGDAKMLCLETIQRTLIDIFINENFGIWNFDNYLSKWKKKLMLS